VVIGIDVSRGSMTYGAFRPEGGTRVVTAKQDAAGFARLAEVVAELASQGLEVWLAYEPTGSYSTCLRERLVTGSGRLVQVNPYHVFRTKEVRDNSPEKSDGKDPGVIADLVWQGCYQQVRPLGGVYAELRAASAEWASLRKRHTALGNEALGLVEVWFPEMRTHLKKALCQSGRAILRRYGSVEEIVAGGQGRLRRLLGKASRNRTTDRAEAVWRSAKESVAPRAGQQARHRHLLSVLVLIEQIEKRQKEMRAELTAWLAQAPEACFLLSAPGVKTISVAGLLGECGELGGYAGYASVEKHLGLDLYAISSGQHKGRRRISKRGRSLARTLLCQIAGPHMQEGGLFADFAQGLRDKGKTGKEVRVAVARKLLRLLYALARTRCLYDPQRFLSGDGAGDGQRNHAGAPMA
jgi:transposase